MAEYGAASIKERTVAGLAAARARTGGRKPKMTPARTRPLMGELTAAPLESSRAAGKAEQHSITGNREGFMNVVHDVGPAELPLPTVRVCGVCARALPGRDMSEYMTQRAQLVVDKGLCVCPQQPGHAPRPN